MHVNLLIIRFLDQFVPFLRVFYRIAFLLNREFNGIYKNIYDLHFILAKNFSVKMKSSMMFPKFNGIYAKINLLAIPWFMIHQKI